MAVDLRWETTLYHQRFTRMNVDEEIQEKTERLMRLAVEDGLAGVLINSQPNFSWLTAGGTNGVDQSREGGVGTLLVRRDGRRFVLANNIEMPRLMQEEISGQRFEPVEFAWEEEKANPTLVAETARSLMSDESPLGADLPMGEARIVEGAIARARYKLTVSEIERFKALGSDAGEAIGKLARTLSPGLTEREVARRAVDAIASIGAAAVVTLAAADDRLKHFRHPVPTDRRWEKVVMIVVCARRRGLIASLTRIVCSGPIPEELTTRTQATARVNARLFAATKPGVTGRELYQVAARGYQTEGFAGEERLHHQGGAAGYRTRDWVAHPGQAEQVQPHQAFAWNPSITGTKVEETCIAFSDGVEIITATPGWPSIPVEVEGRTYLLPDVLSV
jgi:Xaa-Pro aminopeptidase